MTVCTLPEHDPSKQVHDSQERSGVVIAQVLIDHWDGMHLDMHRFWWGLSYPGRGVCKVRPLWVAVHWRVSMALTL